MAVNRCSEDCMSNPMHHERVQRDQRLHTERTRSDGDGDRRELILDVVRVDRPLRVGIVGAGSWAREAHVPGFQRCLHVDVAAICDVEPERASAVAAAAGIPQVFSSVQAMIAATNLDVISIVTPDDSHPADVRASLESGAHVLCEKPLAVDLDDARDLASRARSAGVRTRVGFVLRFAPALAYLHEIVRSGELGEPRHLQAFQQNGQFLDPAAPFHWKMDRRRTGGGAVVEYGIHTIDLALWIMGAASSVSATSRTWVAERPERERPGYRHVDGDDSTSWLMEFVSGATGLCHASWSTVGRPPGLEIRVYGSRGAARCVLADDLPGAQGFWIAGADGHFRQVFADRSGTEFAKSDHPWWVDFPSRLIGDFVADIRGCPASGPTFADGVAAQEVLAAIILSTRERRWVDLR